MRQWAAAWASERWAVGRRLARRSVRSPSQCLSVCVDVLRIATRVSSCNGMRLSATGQPACVSMRVRAVQCTRLAELGAGRARRSAFVFFLFVFFCFFLFGLLFLHLAASTWHGQRHAHRTGWLWVVCTSKAAVRSAGRIIRRCSPVERDGSAARSQHCHGRFFASLTALGLTHPSALFDCAITHIAHSTDYIRTQQQASNRLTARHTSSRYEPTAASAQLLAAQAERRNQTGRCVAVLLLCESSADLSRPRVVSSSCMLLCSLFSPQLPSLPSTRPPAACRRRPSTAVDQPASLHISSASHASAGARPAASLRCR